MLDISEVGSREPIVPYLYDWGAVAILVSTPGHSGLSDMSQKDKKVVSRHGEELYPR